MANFDVWDAGTFVLNPGETAYWQSWWGFMPWTFIWFTAQPRYAHNSVELINQDNWMDENGTIHHNWAIKNNDPNNACVCEVVCLKAWP